MWNRFQDQITPAAYFTAAASVLALALVGIAGCDSAEEAPQNGGGAAGAGVSGGGQTSAGGAQGGQTQAGGVGGQATAGTAGAVSGGAGSSSGGAGAGGGGTGGANGGTGGATSSGCSTGKYLICEDFEATAVGQVPTGWTRKGDAKLSGVAEDSAAGSSKRSLKIGAVANGERRIAHPAAELGAAHWGRIRYRVQAPVPDAFVHATFVALQGVGPTNGAAEYRMIDTVKEAKPDKPENSWCEPKDGRTNCHQWLFNVQTEKAGEFSHDDTPYNSVFDDKWHCAEWHIDGGTQSYELFVDSKRIEQVSFSNGAGNYAKSDIPNTFSELRVGLYNYQSAPPGYTAWIDDIALDEERVGCE